MERIGNANELKLVIKGIISEQNLELVKKEIEVLKSKNLNLLVSNKEMQLNPLDSIIWREDIDSLLGGIYIDQSIEKYSLEKAISFKKFFVFFAPLVIAFSLNNQSVQGKIANKNIQSTINRIIETETSEKKSEVKIYKKEKVLPSKEIESFRPFNDEINQKIENNTKFFSELVELKKRKLSQIQLNVAKPSLNSFSFLAQNPETFEEKIISDNDKSFYTKQLIFCVKFVNENKILIISIIFGLLLLVNLRSFLGSFIKQILKNKSVEAETFVKSSNLPENFTNVSPTNLSPVKEIQEFSNLVLDSKVENLDFTTESISDKIEIENHVNEPTAFSLDPIEEVISVVEQDKLENLRVCITDAENLKTQDEIWTKEFDKFQIAKQKFIDYGDQFVSSDEEWLEIAKAIKEELDHQLKQRIEWEKTYEDHKKNCE